MPFFDAQNTADTLASEAIASASAILTVADQPNRVLKAWLCGDNTGDLQGELALTANDIAMSYVQKSIVSGQTIFEYELIAPPVGSVTVDAAWTTACQYAFIVASVYDVNQTTPNRNLAPPAGNAGSENPSIGVTSAVGDLVMAVVSVNNDDAVVDVGGQTRRASVEQGANGITCAVLTTQAGAAGTVTSSWTAASQRWGAVAISLQPPADLAADAAAVAAAAAQLATAIQMATAAASVSTGTGALTTSAGFAASAQNLADASANLSTAIALLTVAQSLSTSTSGFTDWQTVILADPLYTGPGSIFDSRYWTGAPPQAGHVIHFDPNNGFQIASNGEVSAAVSAGQWVVQYFDGATYNVGLVEFVASELIAIAPSQADASGAFTTAVLAAADAIMAVSAAADLAVSPSLAGGGSGAVSASGDLQTGIQVAAAAQSVTDSAGGFLTAIQAVGDAVSIALATGSLDGALTQLVSDAEVLSSALADITTHKPLQADASALSTVAAALDAAILLMSAAQGVSTAHASFINTLPTIELIGDSTVTVEQGVAWLEPGAIAIDAEDGDITSRLVISGNVDVHEAGSYQLIYNVTDNNGNAAASVFRTINVTATEGGSMPDQFLHGVDLVEIDSGPRPIQTARSSVIGIVGTADDLDAVSRPSYFANDDDWNAAKAAFPINTPVLIAGSLREAGKLGSLGTLPAALNGIFDQVGALVVVVRVASNAQDATEQANVIGGVTGGGQYTGLRTLLGAESVLGYQPRIIIAPGYSHIQAVATEMITIAERLRGTAIIDGPNTTDAAAQAYAALFGSAAAYLVDPWVKVFDTVTASEIIEPASARVAGVMALSDNERGFWWSPSNREIRGIIGLARPVDFKLGDANSRANLLNEHKIATIINQNGYRLWGNLTLSADPKWQFLSVRRTANLIGDSLQRAHMWAVDRNITKNYLGDVTEGVNAYLRTLIKQEALIGGKCWPDPDLNSAVNLAAGKVYFNFDFTAPAPAQTVTFRSMLVDDYYEEIV